MSGYYIIGIRMDNRVENATKLQDVLTKNGCNIKARLGLHEAGGDSCSADGLVILQPCGTREEIVQLVADINNIDSAKAQLMDLN